jgi:hypothetical protein
MIWIPAVVDCRYNSHAMKFAFCALILLAQSTFAGLQKYSSLIVADQNPTARTPSNSIRITYLGVNGFQFETNGHALLVDPYFTRVGLWAGALNERIESKRVATCSTQC